MMDIDQLKDILAGIYPDPNEVKIQLKDGHKVVCVMHKYGVSMCGKHLFKARLVILGHVENGVITIRANCSSAGRTIAERTTSFEPTPDLAPGAVAGITRDLCSAAMLPLLAAITTGCAHLMTQLAGMELPRELAELNQLAKQNQGPQEPTP
jgi:hypothetical protein